MISSMMSILVLVCFMIFSMNYTLSKLKHQEELMVQQTKQLISLSKANDGSQLHVHAVHGKHHHPLPRR